MLVSAGQHRTSGINAGDAPSIRYIYVTYVTKGFTHEQVTVAHVSTRPKTYMSTRKGERDLRRQVSYTHAHTQHLDKTLAIDISYFQS